MSQPDLKRAPEFRVISGKECHRIIHTRARECADVVRSAYRAYYGGSCVNPNSYFLRFPEKPGCRIIALPAHLGGDTPVSGIKWIASYPENVKSGLPRASAVVILNSADTGYPFACLEGSVVSAARTAVSAAIAADAMQRGEKAAARLGVVGGGLIARYVVQALIDAGWSFGSIVVHDLDEASARAFADRGSTRWQVPVEVANLGAALACPVILFATTAGAPHIHDPAAFAHRPLVLHLSLRDLGERVVADAFNATDDIDHVLSAATSLDLASRALATRSIVHATVGDLIDGKVAVPPDRTRIFSPFGLGVLDVAVAKWIYDVCVAEGTAAPISDFFFELER